MDISPFTNKTTVCDGAEILWAVELLTCLSGKNLCLAPIKFHTISLTHLATVPGLTTGPLLKVTALCAGAPGNPQLP